MRLLALALAAGALYAIAHARGWWQGVSDAMPDLEDEMAGVQSDIRWGYIRIPEPHPEVWRN